MNANRISQLVALRNKLNQAGDQFYANSYGSNGYCLYIDTARRRPEWNKRRIRIRNKINARLHANWK